MELDEFTSSIILGTYFVGVGAEVLSHCDHDDSACQMLALASSASGSAISISASLREQRRSELQRRIEALEKERSERDLEDSFDID